MNSGEPLRKTDLADPLVALLEFLSFDPFFEPSFVEVDQETPGDSRELHVGQELGFVDRQDPLDRLDPDDHQAGDEDVDAKVAVQRSALVSDGEQRLPFEGNPTLLELVAEAPFIDRFEQSRPQDAVDLDRRSDNRFRHGVTVIGLIQTHRLNLFDRIRFFTTEAQRSQRRIQGGPRSRVA
jgi:hypothetical protein